MVLLIIVSKRMSVTVQWLYNIYKIEEQGDDFKKLLGSWVVIPIALLPSVNLIICRFTIFDNFSGVV